MSNLAQLRHPMRPLPNRHTIFKQTRKTILILTNLKIKPLQQLINKVLYQREFYDLFQKKLTIDSWKQIGFTSDLNKCNFVPQLQLRYN